MLSPTYLFPSPAACPPLPAASPAIEVGLPPRMALGLDGTAHLLLADAFSVCWWSVNEDNEPSLRAVWPLPGPHPLAIVAVEGAVVLAGVTEEGFALTVIREGAQARDILVGGGGRLLRLEVDARALMARLAWVDAGRTEHRRVDLVSGASLSLGAVPAPARPESGSQPVGVPHGAR